MAAAPLWELEVPNFGQTRFVDDDEDVTGEDRYGTRLIRIGRPEVFSESFLNNILLSNGFCRAADTARQSDSDSLSNPDVSDLEWATSRKRR